MRRMKQHNPEVHNPHSRKSYQIGTPINNFQKMFLSTDRGLAALIVIVLEEKKNSFSQRVSLTFVCYSIEVVFITS